MPLKVIDYSNTHFYKLCCRDVEIKDVYVGHTTDFNRRKRAHKCHCTNEQSQKYQLYVYQCMRDNGGWSNWDMVLLETRSCNNALEARKIEREFVEELGATLNKVVQSRTNAEYREDKKNIMMNGGQLTRKRSSNNDNNSIKITRKR